MSDNFASNQVGLDSPASNHYLVTLNADSPSQPTVLDPKPRYLVALSIGNVEIIDDGGVSITYPVIAGQELRFRASALGPATTAQVAAWY